MGLIVGDVSAQAVESRWTAAARSWLELLPAGEYERAAEGVAPGQAKAAFTPDALRGLWGQLTSQAGPLQGLERLAETTADTLRVVEFTARFERASLIARVVLTPSEEVTGLFFRPAEAAAASDRVAPYADRAAFTEEAVAVGVAPWAVEGTVSLPAGGARVPGVVLVHGSGPSDRDETIGPNRPFRDLAWGLATQGIAVLRYDKRTKVHGASMPPDITVDEEVIEDALSAIAVARAHPRIDPDRVILVGHSLGGMLAPEIALKDGRLAGVVLLAAPARDLATVMLDQLAYIRGLTPESGRPPLDSAIAQVERLAAGETADSVNVLGAPASYFYDLRERAAVASAMSLSVPLLIVHGGRDYQSTGEDFRLWREALAGRSKVEFLEFEDLNHLFMPGQGLATPAEYGQAGFVDQRVVQAIARFALGIVG
jgi:hypothetical protein